MIRLDFNAQFGEPCFIERFSDSPSGDWRRCAADESSQVIDHKEDCFSPAVAEDTSPVQ
jgi:hypothetical protein